jgi:O-antigen ligase
MTTSISNASPPAATSLAQAGATTPALQAQARVLADQRRTTLASRFIILTLCLALVLSTVAFGTVHTWALMFFAAGACLVVALWAADAWRTRTLRVSRNLMQLALAGLIAVGLVQLLPLGAGASVAGLTVAPVRALSLDPYATRFVVVQLASLLVYFAAALVFIDSPARLRLLARAVTVFGFLLALFALLQHFLNPEQIYWLRTPAQAQPFGPFINRHHFAACMELTLGLPLGLLIAGAVERERRVLYLFAVVIMAIALVLTNSRGGVLSLAVEVMFLFIMGGAVRQRKDEADKGTSRVRAALVRAGLGTLLVLALLSAALLFGGEQSLSRLVGTVNADDPTSGRAQFWRGTVALVRTHPVIGAGLGAFGVAYTRHDPLNGALRLEQAHNDYLQILADAGLIGGVLALLFVATLFRQGFARLGAADKFRRGVALGALAACAAVLVHSFFDFPLHITSNALLFLLLAALATADRRVEDETKPRRRRRQQAPAPATTATEQPA